MMAAVLPRSTLQALRTSGPMTLLPYKLPLKLRVLRGGMCKQVDGSDHLPSVITKPSDVVASETGEGSGEAVSGVKTNDKVFEPTTLSKPTYPGIFYWALKVQMPFYICP